ncbi:tRNA lysidine(34) synthetase TilS [Paenibacillus sp. OSY-SE]|uniref:tRNA lysidine(34) synthetase TilS n=1 Tax=Paenibacillus sp. OSY-SE TaxID=1196323 RepID=UPI000363A52E|nr:tRNA lysidine(34) synthetase TilS [Paenibacillus sp. OSY-SE]
MAPGERPGQGRDYAWQQWIVRLKDSAEQRLLWHEEDTIVVAVSGGPDSMLLLYALHELIEQREVDGRGRLIVAHVHHGFRSRESDEEALFVEREAQKLGLPFAMTRVDAPGLAEQRGLNPQAAARELRYTFLQDVAQRYDASHIALAHHADDQAETVLMRMLRGTGSTGLAGMAWKREEGGLTYIRPLLHMRKTDILEWCAMRNIPYVTDSSNTKRDYTRNRLRLDILPLLENENPQLVSALCRMADTLRDEADWLEEETHRLFQRHVKTVNNDEGSPFVSHAGSGYLLDRKTFCNTHVALQRRLIKLILNYLTREAEQIDFDVIDTLRNAAAREHPSTWRMDVSRDVAFVREYDRLLWLRQDVSASDDIRCVKSLTIHRTSTSGHLSLPLNNSMLHWMIRAAADRDATSNMRHLIDSSDSSAGPRVRGRTWEAQFDADTLCWPLHVRSRQPGDRMRVQGLNGSKKVQDMFVDAKIGPSLRSFIPIVTDHNGQIVWVPGVRRSDVALVQPSTQYIIHFVLEGGAHAST